MIELMIVVAIIGILSAMALTVYARVEAGARIVKAEGDLRALATAVTLYATHMGNNPATLDDLNAAAVNAQGLTGGPFMNGTPAVPTGWTGYTYTPNSDGTFTLSGSGDGTTVTLP